MLEKIVIKPLICNTVQLKLQTYHRIHHFKYTQTFFTKAQNISMEKFSVMTLVVPSSKGRTWCPKA